MAQPIDITKIKMVRFGERREHGEETSSEENRARTRIKDGLQHVKVYKIHPELEKKLVAGESNQKCQVSEFNGIAFDNIATFLDMIQRALEVDQTFRQQMEGIKWAEGWSDKIYEFSYRKTGSTKARYCMMAIGKYGRKVDWAHALFDIDLEVEPEQSSTKKDHSLLFGLFNWQTTETSVEERALDANTISQLQNFLRVKALEGFRDHGLLENINYMVDDSNVQCLYKRDASDDTWSNQTEVKQVD